MSKEINTDKVTRVEIIDHSLLPEHGGGRCYVRWPDPDEPEIKVEVVLQDDNRTLKIFISKRS